MRQVRDSGGSNYCEYDRYNPWVAEYNLTIWQERLVFSQNPAISR